MYPYFYKSILVPTCIRFCNIKLYTDTFIESIVAVKLQTRYYFMCKVSTNSYFNGCAGRSRNTWKFHKLNNILRQSGKILLTWVGAFHIHENSFSHFYLNMTLCRWLACHLVHSCICSGIYFITYCSMSLWIPWIHSWIHCFKLSVLARHVSYALLLS